ncbi:uncharacterized protein JCM6883_005106 [Sporobolomyces salmoneus]|uniref:uncharacterized protein n=1 Tax=Sporobolomyces salmoneus TaxID=183962 RepID=UPI003179575D
MTQLNKRSTSLYRSFLRGVRSVSGQDSSKLINLRRSFNPQWRLELQAVESSPIVQLALDSVEQKMHSTLSLLESSRRLTTNLSSLSYHHHPFPLSSTSNSSRLYSHTLKPIEWDPKDAGKAMKTYEKRKKDREEKGEGRLGEMADLGLRGVRERAEREAGVALGRWELRS